MSSGSTANTTISQWDHLERVLEFRYRANLPKVSIIVPTFNNSQHLARTLDSVYEQRYPEWELIVVDAGSQDRTLEILDGYDPSHLRVYTVARYNRYQMWNHGASQATGVYINFLYPGEYYVWCQSMAYMMNLAEQHHRPAMVYCGSMLRPIGREPRILYRPFTQRCLARGWQPTSLSACWVRKDVFTALTGFNTSLAMRGGYDFLCRFQLARTFRCASSSRVLLDYAQRGLSQRAIVNHFSDTWWLIRRHYGWRQSLRWFFKQKDIKRLLHLWWRRVKHAFLGGV